MKGSNILINGDCPNGRFEEGKLVLGLAAACYAGMAVELVPSTEPTNGRFSWQPVQSGSLGDRRPLVIVLGDNLQGLAPNNAYTGAPNALTAGQQIYLYWPLPGDELNLLFENVAGTSDTFTIGQKVAIDPTSAGYGKFIADATTSHVRPGMVEETISTALTQDSYIACKIV